MDTEPHNQQIDIDLREVWIEDDDKDVKTHADDFIKTALSAQNINLDDKQIYDFIYVIGNLKFNKAKKFLTNLEENHQDFFEKIIDFAFLDEDKYFPRNLILFRRRYLLPKKASIISRVFQQSRFNIILDTIKQYKPTTYYDLFRGIVKIMNFSFSQNRKLVPLNQIFSDNAITYYRLDLMKNDILSSIMHHASLTCQASLGYSFNIEPPRNLEHMPHSILALFFTDTIIQLLKFSNSSTNLDLNQLCKDNVNKLVSASKLDTQFPGSKTNMYKNKFVIDVENFDIDKFINTDLKKIKNNLTNIDLSFNLNHKHSARISFDIARDIIKATSYPPEVLFAKDKESMIKKCKSVTYAIANNGALLQGSIEEDEEPDFNFDDLPDLPDLPDENDIEEGKSLEDI